MSAVQRIVNLSGSGRVADHDQLVSISSPEGLVIRSVRPNTHCEDNRIRRYARLFSGCRIRKDNFIVSAATSNDMAVFDAQDADVVRLNSDNVFTGHNTFEESALFNSYVEATSLSVASLSVQSDNFVVDSSSFKEISSNICNNVIKNEENINSISAVIDAKNYLGSVRLEDSSTSLSAWFAQLFNGDGST